MPPRPRCNHRRSEVVAQLHRHHAVAVHHRLRGARSGWPETARSSGRLRRSRPESRPRGLRWRRPPARSASWLARSIANVRVSTPVRSAMPAATSSSTACRRASSTTLTPALGKPLGECGADTVGCAGHQRPRTVLGCERHDGPPDRCDPYLDELAAGHPPPVVATDQLVVVEAGGVDTGVAVAHHDQRVDIGSRLGLVAVDGDHLIGQPVHGVACHRVRLLHELGDRVDAVPGADFAVVQFAVVGEHRAEQRPVPAVDAGRVAQ